MAPLNVPSGINKAGSLVIVPLSAYRPKAQMVFPPGACIVESEDPVVTQSPGDTVVAAGHHDAEASSPGGLTH